MISSPMIWKTLESPTILSMETIRSPGRKKSAKYESHLYGDDDQSDSESRGSTGVSSSSQNQEARLIVDNTFASPINFRPPEFGYDLSLHELH